MNRGHSMGKERSSYVMCGAAHRDTGNKLNTSSIYFPFIFQIHKICNGKSYSDNKFFTEFENLQ